MTRWIPLYIALAASVLAHADPDDEDEEGWGGPRFALEGPSVGGARVAEPTPAYLAGSRIAATGDGAFVIDADSGVLARVGRDGKPVAKTPIGRDAGLLAYDPAAHLVFAVDRRGDRVVVTDEQLAVQRTWSTPAEPYGIALSADRKLVLVTAIADRVLVAYDTSGKEAWRTALSPEPRGIAVSPDGKRALIGSLAGGGLDQIALATHRRTRVALPASTGVQARGAFAVTFLGNRLAVAAFEREAPTPAALQTEENTGGYGGSFSQPIHSALAFLRDDGAQVGAQMNVVLPRSIAWDGTRDVLYAAGMGDGLVIQIAHASQIDAALRTDFEIADSCGVDGMAVAPDGNLFVWCALSRQVLRLAVTAKGELLDELVTHRGPAIAPSSLSPVEHDGMALFHTASVNVAQGGGATCASCHLEGRADGLSWRIEHEELQTPLLAGRIAETAPYKWDGTAKTLEASLRQTVKRLGGGGLGKRDIAALAAYLRQLPAVRTPTRDVQAVARGKRLFESSELGCASCHEGPAFTDQITHQFTGTLRSVDTPGLAGLAASAPYFHDGTAATLEAVIRDRGGVHGMSDAARSLTDAQVADLTAYLETL